PGPRQIAERSRFLAGAGESQYYVEPKRLAKLGYLAARKEPGQTRERTVYSLTEQGLDALERWSRPSAEFTPLKSELLIRLLIADLVGEPATRKGIGALREDIADLLTRLEETRASAESLPHRRKYLLLVAGFLQQLLELHLEFVDEIEHELAARPARTAPG